MKEAKDKPEPSRGWGEWTHSVHGKAMPAALLRFRSGAR